MAQTFSRASTALYKNFDLKLVQAAVNVMRKPHYLAPGKFGLLLEEERTNDFTKSEDLSDAAWTKTGTTITADAVAAPDNNVTADELVEDSSTGEHYLERATPALTDNTKQAFSFFFKPNTRTWVVVTTIDKANTTRKSFFDIGNVAAGTIDGGHDYFLEKYANDFYRVLLRFDSASGATAPVVRVGLATGDNGESYTGDGSSGAYVWGLQYETDKAFPSSYIATDTAAATRSADSLDVDFAFKPQPMTIFIQGYDIGQSLLEDNSNYIFFLGETNQTNDPRCMLRRGTSDGELAFVTDDSVSQRSATRSGISVGDQLAIRCMLNANDIVSGVTLALSINGAAETEDTVTPFSRNDAGSVWGGGPGSLQVGNLFDLSSGSLFLLQSLKVHRGEKSTSFMRKLTNR